MSRFKILVFILTLGVAGSIIATAYWFYTRVLGHDSLLQSEIQAIQRNKTALPDPGIRRFERAVELIKQGEHIEGRNALYDLLRTFPDSNRAPEAKRIIGEINLDMMFSIHTNPQKKKYTVQPGDSLGLIARKQETTIESLVRANGMLHHRLHPGDHLYVFPLDFQIVVNLTKKNLTLLRNDRFFKEYEALNIRLPATVRPPIELIVSDKAAWITGTAKRVLSTDDQFISADKWLMGNRPGPNLGNRPNVNIRAIPQASPVSPKTAEESAATPPPADELDALAETGIFLHREDMEELYTIIRTGTPFKLVR